MFVNHLLPHQIIRAGSYLRSWKHDYSPRPLKLRCGHMTQSLAVSDRLAAGGWQDGEAGIVWTLYSWVSAVSCSFPRWQNAVVVWCPCHGICAQLLWQRCLHQTCSVMWFCHHISDMWYTAFASQASVPASLRDFVSYPTYLYSIHFLFILMRVLSVACSWLMALKFLALYQILRNCNTLSSYSFFLGMLLEWISLCLVL